MSGICGIIALDGANPTKGQIAAMTAPLERRGPDGTHHWLDGPVALGHTLLATTPEALVEVLPLTDPATGCTITADVRLDNRDELIPALGLASETRVIGDGELILRAYLAWGEACLDHLLGDFAFAIWDPRTKITFCGRDQMGMRQLIYCHVAGQLFAFATEPRALLTIENTPKRINEARIADFLEGLESIDFTSTFFEGMYRLPPAHCMRVDGEGLRIWRYWELRPGPELKLTTDEDYAKAFLDILSEAVRCRLRSADPVGSMLSGGMDSTSVAAIASRFLTSEGTGPLQTFSALGPDPETCVETRMIQAAMTMPGIEPHIIDYAELMLDANEMIQLTKLIDEPFDGHMTLPRAVYLSAQRAGMKVVLDGVSADVVMSDGSRLISSLFRQGRIVKAFREAVGLARFFGRPSSAKERVLAGMWRAYVPWKLRSACKRALNRKAWRRRQKKSVIDPNFQSRIDLTCRLRKFESHRSYSETASSQRTAPLSHPSVPIARERYDRVASSFAIEPRDPFLDLRVIAFCLSLPTEQLVATGLPKIIMRRAMAGLLPDTLRWRQSKEHLGLEFTKSLFRSWTGWREDAYDHREALQRYLRPSVRDGTFRQTLDAHETFQYYHLINWLRQFRHFCIE